MTEGRASWRDAAWLRSTQELPRSAAPAELTMVLRPVHSLASTHDGRSDRGTEPGVAGSRFGARSA
jgi:hypothetical protein